MINRIFFEDIQYANNCDYLQLYSTAAQNISNYNVFYGHLFKNDVIRKIESKLEVFPIINCSHNSINTNKLNVMVEELKMINYTLCHREMNEKTKKMNSNIEYTKFPNGEKMYVFHELKLQINYYYNKDYILRKYNDKLSRKTVFHEDIINVTCEEMTQEINFYQDVIKKKNSIYYNYSHEFEKTNDLVLKKLKNISPYIVLNHLKIKETNLDLLKKSLEKYHITIKNKEETEVPTSFSAKIYRITEESGEVSFMYQDMIPSINYKERNNTSEQEDYYKKIFKNNADPTEQELINWSYSGLSDPWGQDFELILAEVKRVPTLIKLMNDEKAVNKHDFFRLVLYVITGQTLNPNMSANKENLTEREELLKIIDSLIEEEMSSELRLWRDRTYYLSENPKSYKKQDWSRESKFLK